MSAAEVGGVFATQIVPILLGFFLGRKAFNYFLRKRKEVKEDD